MVGQLECFHTNIQSNIRQYLPDSQGRRPQAPLTVPSFDKCDEERSRSKFLRTDVRKADYGSNSQPAADFCNELSKVFAHRGLPQWSPAELGHQYKNRGLLQVVAACQTNICNEKIIISFGSWIMLKVLRESSIREGMNNCVCVSLVVFKRLGLQNVLI